MNQELKQAAQQALEAWQRAKYAQPQQDPAITYAMQMVERALTAAQPAQAHASRTCPDACKSPEKCCNFGCQKAHQPAQAGARGVVLPAGWVPLTIEHEPGFPEEVAFGPQRMMDRLKKWLDKHFAALAAQPARDEEQKLAKYLTDLADRLDSVIETPTDTLEAKRYLHEFAHVLKFSASLPTQPAAQATPEPVGKVVAWVYGDDIYWHNAPDLNDHIRASGRPMVFGDTHPAPGVPDVEDLRDRLVAISAAVADLDDRAAQSMLGEILRILAAAQAKGGDPEDLAAAGVMLMGRREHD